MKVILPMEKHAIVNNNKLYVCILGSRIPITLKLDKNTRNPHHEINIVTGLNIVSDLIHERMIDKKTIEKRI